MHTSRASFGSAAPSKTDARAVARAARCFSNSGEVLCDAPVVPKAHGSMVGRLYCTLRTAKPDKLYNTCTALPEKLHNT
jgi:hypothetical protein